MKVALYPGSFNPWHEGHTDILKKAKLIFDKIIVAQLRNPDKLAPEKLILSYGEITYDASYLDNVDVIYHDGLLVDLVKEVKPTAIVKGLRNGVDFEFELMQQYWNEDLGLNIPFAYFGSDRKLRHYSSSAIRTIEKSGRIV